MCSPARRGNNVKMQGICLRVLIALSQDLSQQDKIKETPSVRNTSVVSEQDSCLAFGVSWTSPTIEVGNKTVSSLEMGGEAVSVSTRWLGIEAVSTLVLNGKTVSAPVFAGLGGRTVSTPWLDDCEAVSALSLGYKTVESIEEYLPHNNTHRETQAQGRDLRKLYLLFGWLWSSYLTAIGSSYQGH